MIPEYKYRLRDDSIVTPSFKKWIVAPLFRIIPWWLPANIITIFANMLMYTALIFAITEYPVDRTLRFILIPLLILGFTIGDHFDGMQAKRTGTSSALGELHDHYLDVFNNGILIFIICLLFQITNPILVAFFLIAGYLPHAVTFFEQFTTKQLYFDKIGTLESLVLFCALIAAAAFEPVYHFTLSSSVYGLSVIELSFLILSSGAFFTFVKVAWRLSITDLWFWLFNVLLIVVVCLSAIFLKPLSIFYVITTYSGLYIGNLQRGHLADGKKRFPDIVVPVFMIAAFLYEPLREVPYIWGLYIYLTLHTLWIAGNAFWTLRGFWVWKNPTITKKDNE